MEVYSDLKELLNSEREELLTRIEHALEWPMLILGVVWLGLFIVDMVQGLSGWWATAATAIWVVFIVDFITKFSLAPHKGEYLKRNWLTTIALAIPALRVFRAFQALRILRIARAARGLRLLRLITSLNRGMGALASTMSRRGFGYVSLLTVLVTLGGSAGMYALEHEAAPTGVMSSYGSSLWWTAMIMTTMGSEYWPKTPEGRVLCLLLALYAFAVFGYVTATIASFFVGRDADSDEGEIAGAKTMQTLGQEIVLLRKELEAMRREMRLSTMRSEP